MIKRLSNSFRARVLQPWIMHNYGKTRSGKIISQYQNRHLGEKCFLVGNGPSLTAKDLDVLKENNIPTFAFNRIYNIFEQTDWRPTYYISQDEKMLQGCAEVIDGLDLPVKLIPVQLHWYYNINIHDAIYFNMNWQQVENPLEFLFSDNAAHQLHCASTGMYTAAQLAAYMGFKELYFIGVDHHFQISQNNAGEIIVDNTVKDYFTDKYNEDKENLYIPNTEKSTLTYIALKRHCEQRGIKVFNATRGGKLEVFPRIEFDKMFEDKQK